MALQRKSCERYCCKYQWKTNFDITDLFKVTNDRWGSGALCKHGGYYTCADRYNPGHLITHKWENCFTVNQKLKVSLLFTFVFRMV